MLSLFVLSNFLSTPNFNIESINIEKFMNQNPFSIYGVPDKFSKYFSTKNTASLFSWTESLILYTDEKWNFINNFEDINNNSTAHIFSRNSCEDWFYPNFETSTPIHLKSISCNNDFCEFENYNWKTMEENQSPIIWWIHHIIMHIDLEDAEKFETWWEYLQTLEEFDWWKDFEWNKLYHPKNWIIPAIFSWRQDC